jgi:hypothetical protein
MILNNEMELRGVYERTIGARLKFHNRKALKFLAIYENKRFHF